MNKVLIGIACFLLFSCESAPGKLDNDQLNELTIDSAGEQNESILTAKLGAKTLKIDDQKSKCNLKRGYYLISEKLDSSILAFGVKKMANELFLSLNPGNSCEYKKMSAAYFFFSEKDFHNDYPVATCRVTPDNYGGVVYVNMSILNSIKTKK